ncbi:MAG: hypothetical protein AABZ02_10915 [Bacteroidota bacterium]
MVGNNEKIKNEKVKMRKKIGKRRRKDVGGEKGDVRSGKWEVGRRQNSGDRMQNTTDERNWNLELETLNFSIGGFHE